MTVPLATCRDEAAQVSPARLVVRRDPHLHQKRVHPPPGWSAHVVAIGRGRTYAEMEDVRTNLTARIAAAQANGDPEQPKLQKELGELTGQREALFKAEMLRGALLTSFGFSTLGGKAAQGATLAYGGAGIVALLSLAGLVQARRTADQE